jgi:EH_Signature domain
MSGHLATALTRLEAQIQAMSLHVPPEPPTARMLRTLRATQAAVRPPELAALEALRARLRDAISGGVPPDPKDLKRAPWILWRGEPAAIGFAGLLDMVVGQAARSSRTLRYLIEAWLRDFSPDSPGIAQAGEAIRRLLADSTDPRFDGWRAADRSFQLFDARHGPAALAGVLLSGSHPVVDMLEAAELADAARAISGYLRAVQSEVLTRLSAGLTGPGAGELLARACVFLSHGDGLRFDDKRADIAHALCQPWLTPQSRAADSGVQRPLQDFLMARIGNPQLRPGRWIGAEREAALVRQWLARASLRVFFDLISDHAHASPDQGHKSQWKYREAFWSACLRKRLIDDAWLALGAKVHASARAKQDLGSAFGRLQGPGASGDQSVLLLRIGPLVFAEWSHNGPLRAWKAEQAPKLAAKSYTGAELKRPCLPFPDYRSGRTGNQDTSGLWHTGAANYVWQRRAALLLARHANVILQAPDWRPQ